MKALPLILLLPLAPVRFWLIAGSVLLLWLAASFIALLLLNLLGWSNRRRFPNP
jgi:hypothetical protein